MNNNSDKDEELFLIFQSESEEILEHLLSTLFSLEKDVSNIELINKAYRELHSLKGAVRMVGFNNIQQIYHKMEDIFDAVIHENKLLTVEIIKTISKMLEASNKYLQDSIRNRREIIDENFTPILDNVNYILEVELNDISPLSLEETILKDALSVCPDLINDLEDKISDLNDKINDFNDNVESQVLDKEKINYIFNNCFEIIDGITPEEESSDIVILKEEVQKLYEDFKDTDLYEIKKSLENVIAKVDFVINATNTLTISEILELRNELSSAASKYTTSCISTEQSSFSFFDIAQKISMLQGSSIYTKEIKDDILSLKNSVTDTNIVEIIDLIILILDFITENSVQLEEQMVTTIQCALEFCGSQNENVDSDLIIQQLEILKQLLELSYKKDTGVSEIKNFAVNSTTTKSSSNSEIKTLHVNAQKLDLLVNQLGELIITKIKTEKNLEKIENIKSVNETCQKDLLKTSNYLRYYNRKYLQSPNSDQYSSTFVKQVFSLLSDVTQNISKTIYDLNSLYRASKEDDIKMRLIIDEMESMVKNIRVLPISTVFNSFTRMVRDIATEKNKEIDFEIIGNDTCADKKIIEEIKTPLIHILRNAIDHGIETKNERLEVGKSPVGKIILKAKQDDNNVILEVIDDGHGFNLEKIKDRAVSRGFLTQEDIDSMSDEAIMNIIFWPGFTTGDSITSISGRGIGLDVVKTKISQLNGKVRVISEFGKGSCVRIEIPVTLATLRVFVVKVAGQVFAIPIQLISTFIIKKHSEIRVSNGLRSILYNDEIIPLYYLADILQIKTTEPSEKETILIIEADDKKIGLVVDKLIGDQDILQKKLAPPLYKVKNISGITNLASGEMCLILNMQDILHYDFNKIITSNVVPKVISDDIVSYKRILIVDDSVTTRTMMKNILCSIGYTVESALSAADAMVKLKLNHYDLIITDFNMPDKNGFEFIELLKNDEMYMDIPIILMTSELLEKIKNKNTNYDIDYYICKDTFNQAEFVQQVKYILTKYHV